MRQPGEMRKREHAMNAKNITRQHFVAGTALGTAAAALGVAAASTRTPRPAIADEAADRVTRVYRDFIFLLKMTLCAFSAQKDWSLL